MADRAVWLGGGRLASLGRVWSVRRRGHRGTRLRATDWIHVIRRFLHDPRSCGALHLLFWDGNIDLSMM